MKTVEKLLKRGKISTRDEYELLINRVDEIYADPDKADELERLNAMLAAYRK